MKKQILLTALTLTLLASTVMTAAAEEVVATIVGEPKLLYGELSYDLDTIPGDGIIDRRMGFSRSVQFLDEFNILPRYLKDGWKVVYENDGLRPFQGFGAGRLIDIISPDGNHIDLTTLFSLTRIQYNFPYLYAKLVREGRAR
jgi:hypothetical protein